MCIDNKKLSILGQTWQQIHGCIPEPKKSNIKKYSPLPLFPSSKKYGLYSNDLPIVHQCPGLADVEIILNWIVANFRSIA